MMAAARFDPKSLAALIRPCGPVIDAAAADRVHQAVAPQAETEGLAAGLDAAWPALQPVFAASPYLAGVAERNPPQLLSLLRDEPDERLEAIVAAATGLAESADVETAQRGLRRLKTELHLLTALADLGGVWSLDKVTSALSRFADAACQTGLVVVARTEQVRGQLLASPPIDGIANPVPGLFCIALGKLGGFELNYSSDIDISIFYAPEAMPAVAGADRQALAVRLTKALAALLQARTTEGYVFRVDLRLRPDPAATPAAMPVGAAIAYYQTAGQNWERAAMIKARPCAGDLTAAQAFLDELQPFIWRRSLDYAAIADIHAIKRQIHVHKVDERLSAPGHNLKLGAGGIREIEFFVQTQQLILGGRDRRLRSRRTVDALEALADAGHVAHGVAKALATAYADLRRWEHRVQMIADEQTHVLPETQTARRAVAALAGFADTAQFDAAASAVLSGVNAHYAELFALDEPLSSAAGSLVFTGVEDDPETLDTLERMGFSRPAQILSQIRDWHYGRIAATRTERGRELFTRLAPRLLEAAEASGAADAAFNRFADFFARLPSGVQVQSLLLAQPRLFKLIVEVMAFAPELASVLARQPATLDALLDPDFFRPVGPEAAMVLASAIDSAEGFEAAMGAARRTHREQAFRIGVQLISGRADAGVAGRAFTALADACIAGLARHALAETERAGGAFPGQVAIVALGRAGSREMTARSDLDLMTLYAADEAAGVSTTRGWGAETFYARFTQRLITALSAPTAEGELYPVDLQLRPSGRAGPIAVSLETFAHYHAHDAATWEAMALTRARVIWSSQEAFRHRVDAAIMEALRRPRTPAQVMGDAAAMRGLMRRERRPDGFWDLKLSAGGLVDIEFVAQALQVAHASRGGPLRVDTGEALAALRDAGLGDPRRLSRLSEAWRVQQDLWQVMKLALEDGLDPTGEPERFKSILAHAADQPSFSALETALAAVKSQVHADFDALLTGGAGPEIGSG